MHGGGGGGMRGGGMRGGGGGYGGGFRGGGFPGGGYGGGFRGGGFRGGFRGGYGRFGRGFGFGFSPFFGYGGFYSPFIYDPFWYDSFADYSPYSYPYSYGSPYGYPNSGYSNGGPSVMIISNAPYGYPAAEPPAPLPAPGPPEPVIRQPQAEQKYETPLYLVAFQDGVIRAVLAYWVDGGMLHYVTMDHEQKQAALSSIDRDLSERFNRERNVTFRLPR